MNEAYLKWIRAHGIRCENRLQFLLSARKSSGASSWTTRATGVMPNEAAAAQILLDEELIGARTQGADVLALDEALTSLSTVDPRKGVELRYFGGLSVEETAEALRMSPETAKRDWKVAKAWLFRELSGARRDGAGA